MDYCDFCKYNNDCPLLGNDLFCGLDYFMDLRSATIADSVSSNEAEEV